MHPDLIPLHRMDELDALVAEDQPVVVFKHSGTCGISAEALDELVEHVSRSAGRVRYAIITVQTDRALSNAVAQRFGVRHETPQVLIVRGGRVVWSATHFRVTADAVSAALGADLVAQ